MGWADGKRKKTFGSGGIVVSRKGATVDQEMAGSSGEFSVSDCEFRG
jgi:hypothetical protein